MIHWHHAEVQSVYIVGRDNRLDRRKGVRRERWRWIEFGILWIQHRLRAET